MRADLGLAVFFAVLFAHMAAAVLGVPARELGRERQALRQQVVQLRRKAEALNAPSTFAQSAKLLRQSNALEKRLKAANAELGRQAGRTQAFLRAFKGAACVLALAFGWGTPAVTFPADVSLWPIGYLFTAPDCRGRGPAQVVSGVAWVFLCDRLVDAGAKALLPAS